jgi:hypothetical protein
MSNIHDSSNIRKVVINTCFGGFKLSSIACEMYATINNLALQDFSEYEISRDDATLVMIVEQLGQAANGSYARLKIVEIPANVQWQIDEYDGVEHVAEVHRTWR